MVELDPAARRARRVLRIIVMLVLWGLITHGTHAGSGDEPHYLAIAHSIAFDGDLDLSNNYGANEPLIGGGVLAPEAHVRAGAGGVARPVHDVGLPLVFVPIVRVAVPLTHALTSIIPAAAMQRARLTPAVLYRHLISLAMIAIAAALAGLMFETFTIVGGSVRAAFASALLIALSPPLLIMSVLFFTEVLAALVCLFVFQRTVLVRTTGAHRWLTIGVATGFLWLVHARNIGLIVPLAALALESMRGRVTRRDASAYAIGLATMMAVRTAINYHFWGTLLVGPHARFGGLTNASALLKPIGIRAAGLFVDQEFGLLIYAPIYLLMITGFVALSRQKESIARRLLEVVGFYLLLIVLPITNVHGWSGGWNPPGRFLTPIVPLLAIALFAGLRTGRREIVAILLAAQIAIDAYAWQHPKVMWNDGDGRAAFCDRFGDRICRVLPSLADNRVTPPDGGGRQP